MHVFQKRLSIIKTVFKRYLNKNLIFIKAIFSNYKHKIRNFYLLEFLSYGSGPNRVEIEFEIKYVHLVILL